MSTRLGDLQATNQMVRAAGIVYAIRVQQTRRGRVAIVTLDDGSARLDLTVFNELFEEHRSWLKEDELVIVEGKVALDNFTQTLRLSADRLFNLASARNCFARGIRLHCNGESNGARLKEILGPYRNGACPVSILYNNANAEVEVRLGEDWNVNLRDDLIQALGNWIKPDDIEIVYS